MVEFMVVNVEPLYSSFRKAWWNWRRARGFEYMTVEMIWAFEDKPDQKNWEIHPNDLVRLNDGSRWVVIGRTEGTNTLFLRLFNKSRYQYKTEAQTNGLYGEGVSIGKVAYR